MKKITLAIALAIASLGSAHAQTDTKAADSNNFRVMIGMGITGGGDTLATAYYEKNSKYDYYDDGDYNIKAGGIVAFTGGVDFRVTPEFSLQSTISYHVDQANASNGDIKFARYPIELLAYYHPNAQWRVGGGVRYVSSPKLSSSGVARGINATFDNTVSAVVEAEYFFSPNFGAKFRYVNEKYEKKGYTGKVDANHVGIFGNYYF